MATSGSVDFSITRDQLIKTAFQQSKILGEGDTPSATQVTEASILLNMIVKLRQADGMPLWALKQGYLLPQTDLSSVSTGTHIVTTYVTTTTSAASAAAATTLTLTSVSGISNGMILGVADSANNVQWFTISTVVGSIVTLPTALAASVASGSRVYAYSTSDRITRPLRVLEAYLLYTAGSNRNKLNLVEKDSFFKLGNLTSESIPNQMYYDPQVAAGVFYFYPRFSGGDNVIEFTYHRPFEDFDSASDTPDFPQEWYLPLMMELSFLIGASKGLTLEERMQALKESEFYHQTALTQGYPEGSIYFQPGLRDG